MDDPEVASIWIVFKGRGRQSVVVGGTYREHTRINLLDPEQSADPKVQTTRWKRFIRQWKMAINSYKYCWVVGDTNLDKIKWDTPDSRHLDMVNLTKNYIETKNCQQIFTGSTRSWPGQVNSLIDQVWTNDITKVISQRNVIRAISDHNVISVKIRLKGQDNPPTETLCRNRTKMDKVNFIKEVGEIDWTELLETTDVNIANDIFVTKVGGLLDKAAPLRKIQVRNKVVKWISEEAKVMIEQRDEKRAEASRTGDRETWKEFRILKNRCNAKIIKDRKNHKKETYEELEKKTKMDYIHWQRRRWDGRLPPPQQPSG